MFYTYVSIENTYFDFSLDCIYCITSLVCPVFLNALGKLLFSFCFVLFREREWGGRKGKKNINLKEKHPSVSSHTPPDQGQGVELVIFHFARRCPTN